ncbi:MAG TPA: 6-carboxytetrahydropterin synthase QueD [Thermoanaerobaculia bacterium]|nr:6-carboxytetrahydropterin synthase QueD [Thermoanaerobaculia bacterium]
MAARMHTVFKDFTFAAAHAIRGHTRGCQNLHGHNYRVRVYVRAAELDGLGMVLDFADLKEVMQAVLGPFDHRVINEVPPFDRRNTTAELLSEYVYAEVARRLPGERRLAVSRVEVWENETSCAVFEPDGPPSGRCL